jgi:hypothetical protein
MPGKKYRSLKAPGTYERMRKHGMSKSKAARLSNYMAKRGYKVRKTVNARPRRVKITYNNYR